MPSTMEAPKPAPKKLFSVGKTNPLLDVTLPSRRGGPCMHAKRQKHSTANEGQSTKAVTPQYRGSALPPDLGKNTYPQCRSSDHLWAGFHFQYFPMSPYHTAFSPRFRKAARITILLVYESMQGAEQVALPNYLNATRHADAKEIYERY